MSFAATWMGLEGVVLSELSQTEKEKNIILYPLYNPLQYSCLGNPMDRRAWWGTVHGVAQSWT